MSKLKKQVTQKQAKAVPAPFIAKNVPSITCRPAEDKCVRNLFHPESQQRASLKALRTHLQLHQIQSHLSDGDPPVLRVHLAFGTNPLLLPHYIMNAKIDI